MRAPSVLLFFALLAVLALSAVAQSNNNDAKTTSAATADTKTTTAATNTKAADTKASSKADVPSLTTEEDKTSTTAKAASTTTQKTVEATITASGESATDSNLPSISSTKKSLPKLSLGYTIPTVTPPPTKGAPFMQRSSLPEGTVFIAVGAGLGFFALVILAWRGLVAWSLHRSVKRAAHASAYADTKAMLRPPHQRGGKSTHSNNGAGGGGFYAAGPGSTLSLDHLASSGRNPAPPAANSSLFFSPTSNAAGGSERRSTYLPAGFYASGTPGNRNSAAPSNNSQTHFHNQSVSSRGGLAAGRSPPASPLIDPAGSRGNASVANTERLSGIRINDSTTSLNLPPTGRAPSAYLEDLFESHRQAPGSQGQGRY